MPTNIRLIDVLTRQQVYIEGVKAYQGQQFNTVLLNLITELRKAFSSTDYESMDEFTKAELKSFINTIKDSQNKIYNGYTSTLLSMLRDFMEIQLDLSDEIFKQASDQDTPVVLPTPDAVWSLIVNAILPANGLLPSIFINNFVNSATSNVENLIRKGYANNFTVKEVLKQIIGTQALNYRDGQLNTVGNQGQAVINTTMQHVSELAKNSVGKLFFRRYQWISVIDNRTTAICRSRDLKIYFYGSGPLPPAHINCRSGVVPVGNGQVETMDIPTYYSWLKEQPLSFLTDVLGKDKAAKLQASQLSSEDFTSFDGAQPISLNEFKGKLNNMLAQ